MIKISLNKSDILIVKEIIDKINDCDNLDNNSNSIPENLLEENNVILMKTLLELKKGNLRRILSYINSNNKKEKKIEESKFNMTEILEIFDQKSNEEIEKRYSLNELRSMHFTIYEIKSQSKDTKRDLVSTIRNYIYGRKRANSFRVDI